MGRRTVHSIRAAVTSAAVTSAAVIAFGVVVPILPAAAAPPPLPPNLIANGSFDQAYVQPGLSPWACDGTATAVPVEGSAISDFALAGTPSGQSTAECSQTIPVQPNSTNRVSGRFKGGYAVLGTDYGATSTAGTADWTTLTLAFTTGPDTVRIRVYVRGGYLGPTYYADRLTLNGPASTVLRPVRPTNLVAAEQRSRSVSLYWTASPGASRYLVYRDGVLIATTGTTSWTSFYVRNLTPGATHTYTVEAANSAGPSAPADSVTSTAAPAYDTPPPPPGPISVSVTGRVATLSWDPVPTATDGYQVYFVESDSSSTPFDPSHVMSFFGPGTFTVTVSAWNSAGRSVESAPVSITVT